MVVEVHVTAAAAEAGVVGYRNWPLRTEATPEIWVVFVIKLLVVVISKA